MGMRKKISGLTLGLVGFDISSGISKVEPEPSLSLRESLKSMAIHWFGMKVTASESWGTSPPDIYIANESESSLESLR